MKARSAVIVTFTAAAALAAVLWWRRRGALPAASPVQLGLSDGSVHDLPAGDAALAELASLAAGVRQAFESVD